MMMFKICLWKVYHMHLNLKNICHDCKYIFVQVHIIKPFYCVAIASTKLFELVHFALTHCEACKFTKFNKTKKYHHQAVKLHSVYKFANCT